MAEGKYAEAAEEFSAASAADPEVTGYKFSIQGSCFKEGKSRIIRVVKDKKYTINRSIEPDLPIYGPYIEKDHYQRISQFDKIFARIPGKQEAIDNAMHQHWEIRYGGILQIKTGQQLGPENVRAFEERHRKGRVDIATKDNIAIECKNFSRPWARLRDIEEWLKQAVSRFEPDEKGHRYNGVLIVIPDDKNLEEIELTITSYIKLNHPKLLDKIKVSELADLRENLSSLAKR